jgi:hypothetical protein
MNRRTLEHVLAEVVYYAPFIPAKAGIQVPLAQILRLLR